MVNPTAEACIAGRIAGFRETDRVTGVPSGRRPLRQWALLAALVLCVGQSVADAHPHQGEHESEICTLCAICEPGHGLDVGWVDARPPEWRRSDSVPVLSATVSPRPYEVGRPRAPPIS